MQPTYNNTLRATRSFCIFFVSIYVALASVGVYAQATVDDLKKDDATITAAFNTLLSTKNAVEINHALLDIDRYWDDAYLPQMLDLMSVPPSFVLYQQIHDLLKKKTGEDFIGDTHKWYSWLWNKAENRSISYPDFKADLYKRIDPVFQEYFRGRGDVARIRIDEVRWGGVLQDGIPPLHNPKMMPSKKATYLGDNDIVFGIEVNGDARAYPKRILAWHEMFTDTIGGVDIAGVYCTLCGTVIPFKTNVGGKKYKLGTSGFLYRSNKLMYDQATQSLWSTVKGEPVIGPLVDKGIKLEHLGMVTTTWGEWKRRHPDTTVLSLDTGHRRDYGEGVAYSDYFSDHRLMFNTPFNDDRLQNKQEVLALVFPASPREQLAIDTTYLTTHFVYEGTIGQQKFIVLTDASGANRVYDPQDITFVSYDQDRTLTDSEGNEWVLEEEHLRASVSGQQLKSLPYRRAFWFGWHAAYPQTRLIM